jgi:RNA polymerase sigma-70 factor (ECF subfamily)
MTVGATDQIPRQFDEDTLLAARFLAGDAGAFDTLYHRYYDRVYAIARGVLLDADEAQDATQEAFALIFRNLSRFNKRSKLGTWIFRIAVNSAIQHSRRTKNLRRNEPLDETLQSPAEPLQPTDTVKVNLAMGALAPADRAVLTLFYWDDLSLVDIAATLNCGANAAKTRLYRARERFRIAYEALEDSNAD